MNNDETKRCENQTLIIPHSLHSLLAHFSKTSTLEKSLIPKLTVSKT